MTWELPSVNVVLTVYEQGPLHRAACLFSYKIPMIKFISFILLCTATLFNFVKPNPTNKYIEKFTKLVIIQK